jgi:hypothetical protein
MAEQEAEEARRIAEAKRRWAEQVRLLKEHAIRVREMEEGRKREAEEGRRREEAERLNSKKRVYREWRIRSEQLILQAEERKRLSLFPDPPITASACCVVKSKDCPLRLCVHGLEEILRCSSDEPFSVDMVGKWRLRWHPDKFACCPEEIRAEWQSKATVIFQLAGELIAKLTK